MDLLAPELDPADPQRVAIEATRTSDRLRTLTAVRLAASLPEGGSRAARAFELAQQIADRTAVLDECAPRPLPALPDTVAGDVLAVCVSDLLDALQAHPDPAAVADISRALTGDLIALRSLL